MKYMPKWNLRMWFYMKLEWGSFYHEVKFSSLSKCFSDLGWGLENKPRVQDHYYPRMSHTISISYGKVITHVKSGKKQKQKNYLPQPSPTPSPFTHIYYSMNNHHITRSFCRFPILR